MQPDGFVKSKNGFFQPTKVSIIDSVIMNNYLWYKVVGS